MSIKWDVRIDVKLLSISSVVIPTASHFSVQSIFSKLYAERPCATNMRCQHLASELNGLVALLPPNCMYVIQ